MLGRRFPSLGLYILSQTLKVHLKSFAERQRGCTIRDRSTERQMLLQEVSELALGD
jgi:hypothetical protein